LKADAERARHVRKRVREMLNSRGEWELMPSPTEKALREIFVMARLLHSPPIGNGVRTTEGGIQSAEPGRPALSNVVAIPFSEKPEPKTPEHQSSVSEPSKPVLYPALSEPAALEKVGTGVLTVLIPSAQPLGSQNSDPDSNRSAAFVAERHPAAAPNASPSVHEARPVYGRKITVAELLNNGQVLLVKWIRRLTHWNGRQTSIEIWNEKIVPLLEQKLAQLRTPVVRFETHGHKILALVSIADLQMRVPVDSYGVALWHPIEREVLPLDCARCSLVPVCRELSTGTGVAMLWRRLGLVDAAGVPTLRGQIVSFFSHGAGLGIAAALEEASYSLDELIYDLANLDAGFRFCGEENRWAGRLPMACYRIYGIQSIPGYLENGVPLRYGSGAEQIVACIHKNPLSKSQWITELLGAGDIDRVIIEWRSLLRQISQAPTLAYPRWQALQTMAKAILHQTESPTMTDLPPLDYHQTRRIEHQLILRRH
jgi:hypothetical protein